MKGIAKITIQNHVPKEVKISLNREEIGIIRGATTTVDFIVTGKSLTIKASSANAIDATENIDNISHGDSFTFVIRLDQESSELKIERKY